MIRRLGGPGMHGVGGIPLSSMAGAPMGGPWWNPLGNITCTWAAYQPKGAASFAASLLDLSGTGNNAIDPGGAASPTWDAVNGWTFDGIGDYLTTTFIPENDGTQSGIVQFSNVTNSGALFGASYGAGRRFIIYPNDGTVQVQYHNGGSTNAPPALLAGNLAIAGQQGYRNGVAEAAIAAWGGVIGAPALSIASVNDGAGLWLACRIQALALYDCTLTAPQVLAIATAMAAL